MNPDMYQYGGIASALGQLATNLYVTPPALSITLESSVSTPNVAGITMMFLTQ